MISDYTFAMGIDLLQRHHKQNLEKDVIGIWRRYLDQELDDEQFAAAVDKSILASAFMPTPEKLVEYANGSLQTKAMDEWRTLVLRGATYSVENQQKILPTLSVRCRVALQNIGGFYAVGIADEWELRKLEKQFLTIYCECSPGAKILPPAHIQPNVFVALPEERKLPVDSEPKSEALQRVLEIARLKSLGQDIDERQSAINLFILKWKWQIDDGRLECYLAMNQQQKLGFGVQFGFAMRNSHCKSAVIHFDKITGYVAPPPTVDYRAIAREWLEN